MVFFKKKIEEQLVNIAVAARKFSLKVKTMYHIYKEHLSDYRSDIKAKTWCKEKTEAVNKKIVETGGKPLCVFKSENLGKNMSIDDRATGHDGFTILSNNGTEKTALPVETRHSRRGRTPSMEKFGDDLQKIKNISMDKSLTYAPVFNRPLAKLRNQIKITNSGDKVEAQTETFPPVTITFREDSESFDKAGGVFICHSRACDNPVFAH